MYVREECWHTKRIDKFTWYIAVLGKSRQTAQHSMPPRRASNFSIILVEGLSIFFRFASGSSSSGRSDGRPDFFESLDSAWLALFVVLPKLRFSSWLVVMIWSDKFMPWVGWVATEINNVEAWPAALDEDGEDEDEDAATDEVEEEGIDEVPDEEPGCKSAGSWFIPPRLIKWLELDAGVSTKLSAILIFCQRISAFYTLKLIQAQNDAKIISNSL